MARSNATDKQPKPESDSPAVTEVGSVIVESAQGSMITVYPLRTYLDGKEMRRAGEPYQVAKHEAAVLKAKKLVSDEEPKA